MSVPDDRAPTAHERMAGQAWDASYRDGPPPWDAGGPRAAVLRLCEGQAFTGQVLDAGCGAGEDALEIARRGLDVLGIDVAPTAIAQAREKAASRGIAATFEVADALGLQRLGRRFASVLDSGLFHTFDDDEQRRYVDGLAAVTAPGATLHLLCVSDRVPDGPGPQRRVSQAELRAAFASSWDVVSIEADRLEVTFAADGLPAWRARIERV